VTRRYIRVVQTMTLCDLDFAIFSASAGRLNKMEFQCPHGVQGQELVRAQPGTSGKRVGGVGTRTRTHIHLKREREFISNGMSSLKTHERLPRHMSDCLHADTSRSRGEKICVYLAGCRYVLYKTSIIRSRNQEMSKCWPRAMRSNVSRRARTDEMSSSWRAIVLVCSSIVR
jgi:hypothetical protein